MAIRKFKPTSPSRRFYEAPDFDMITRGKPEKKLLDAKKQTAGRNNQGRITSRFRGGGHKQRYRKIDFKRNKVGVPATVKAIEYDPNRSARIALPALRRRREVLHSRAGRPRGGRAGGLLEERRREAGQRHASSRHAARHDDSQHRAQDRQGRAARSVSRARPRSSWPRTATTRRFVFPPARFGSSTSTAVQASVRSATRSTRA